MTSEKARKEKERLSPALAQDVQLGLFLQALEQPAALLSTHFDVLAANPPFALLCGVPHAEGHPLPALLPTIEFPLTLADGSSIELEHTLLGDRRVRLQLSRRGEGIAVIAHTGDRQQEEVDARHRIEQALLDLGRKVAGATSEEQLVAAAAHGVKALFPGRMFCIRIADPKSLRLTSLYAEGRLKEEARDTWVLKRSAVQKTKLDTSALPTDRFVLTDEVPLLFQVGVRALAAPLVASGQLFGALQLEYPQGLAADANNDERLLLQLANQIAVAVRNVKLIDELTYVRRYLEELLEHANALIVVVDRERRIVVFNRAFSELTGLNREEVLGTDFLTYIPEGENNRVSRGFGASLEGENATKFETRVLGSDGRSVRVSFATAAVRDAQGEVDGVIAIGQDLTMVKELEQRIIQAEKLASLGQLAASVAHEINNPMTAVATYADALLQRSRTVGQALTPDQEKLQKIVESSHRILRFTRDLTSYARPAKETHEPVDLHQILDMALGFCDHVVSQAGVKVVREFAPVPRVSGIRGNLAQVFVNLITNACHAMPPGGTVTIATRTDGPAAFVDVRDTGKGIEARHLDEIFKPFFTTKPEGVGTGLGLSIVQGIIESHGGTVTVTSEIDVGTQFSLRLPLIDANRDAG